VALSAFDDKARPPAEDELREMLGRSWARWQELPARVGARFGPVAAAWGYASRSTGWGLRLRAGDRTILHLTPCTGHFLASFALGANAVRAALGSTALRPLHAAIRAAPQYAEGRGVRLRVTTKAQVAAAERLAVIKMES
jgi:hypothetical protein